MGCGVVMLGAGPLLDNPPQPKRGDSPDGESFGYAATLRAANEWGGEREGPEPAEAAVRKREISESERFRADLGEKKREKEEFFGRVEKERRR